jgi:hypothetical protein
MCLNVRDNHVTFIRSRHLEGTDLRCTQEVWRQSCITYEKISLVESHTMIKNHIHALLDRYKIQPTCTDIFGKRGREWLRNLNLPSIKEYVRLPPNVK